MSNNIPTWIRWKPVLECQKMACACQLKNKTGLMREHCENDKGCGNFVRMDFGCWILGNGSKPVRRCNEDCNCPCHQYEEDEE